MRTAPVITGAAILLVTGCNWPEGAGTPSVETRRLPEFERVELEGRTRATVRIGDAQRVVLRGGERLLDAVTTTVTGGTLTIDRSDQDRALLEATIVVKARCGGQ